MLMNEHDDAYVNAMLMVNMQANTRSVTLVRQNIPISTQAVFSSITKLDSMSNQIKEGYSI